MSKMSKNVNEPLVSILMPNYNNEKFITETIESILNQTYTNFEFIICDDCSTDNSWKIIQKFVKKDSRIKAFRNEKNLQIVKTRNKLFTLMSEESKYVAIIDSDDVAMSKRLELQVDFLEKHADFGLVGGNLIIIDENSKEIARRSYLNRDSELRKHMLIKNNFAQPTVMMRRSVLDIVGEYSNEFEVCEDWDFWIRCLNHFKGANLKEITLKYRFSSTQSKSVKYRKTIINGLKVKFKHMKFKDYFSFNIMGRILLECIALLLPRKIVMGVFEKMEMRK